jgi:hypothetical protein
MDAKSVYTTKEGFIAFIISLRPFGSEELKELLDKNFSPVAKYEKLREDIVSDLYNCCYVIGGCNDYLEDYDETVFYESEEQYKKYHDNELLW